VTHQAIFHLNAHRFLLNPSIDPSVHRGGTLPAASTPLRHTLSTLFSFFAQTYKDVFGFQDGPPVHDALVVAYIAKPHIFKERLCRVDAELSGKLTRGALVVDTYDRAPGCVRNVGMAVSVIVSFRTYSFLFLCLTTSRGEAFAVYLSRLTSRTVSTGFSSSSRFFPGGV